MNSKEFEILNMKLDSIFRMVTEMRERIDLDSHRKEVTELERKAESARYDYEGMKENVRYIDEYYSANRKEYRDIERRVNDRYESRLREATEQGTKMHPEEVKEGGWL